MRTAVSRPVHALVRRYLRHLHESVHTQLLLDLPKKTLNCRPHPILNRVAVRHLTMLPHLAKRAVYIVSYKAVRRASDTSER